MTLRIPSWRWTLIGLFLIASLVRVVFVLSLQPGFYFWDSVKYDRAAVSLLNQGTFGAEYDRSPAYPLFLAGIYLVLGKSILSIRLVEAVLGGVIAVLLAVIGKRTVGRTSGLLAGLIWTFYPLAVFLAGLVYPETIITLFLAGAVALLLAGIGSEPVSGQRPAVSEAASSVRPLPLIAAGLLMLLAFLAKPVVAATFLGVCVWLVLWKRWRSLPAVGLLVAGFCLPLVLWVAVSSHYFGRVIISDPRAGRMVDRVGSTNMDEVRKGRIQRILEDPGAFVVHVATEFAHFWQIYPERVVMSDQSLRDKFHERDARVVRKTVFNANSLTAWASILSIGPVFLLALGGVFFLVRDRRWADLSLLAFIVLSFAVAYSFFFTQLRYRIPVEPYIILLAGHGLAMLGELVWRRRAAKVSQNPVTRHRAAA
ncbi:MAG: hypothetical protein EHM61_00840 [Acidobacteria bacterium]|nr:MAG: hypothetical protein EHM61_00840 [Acidobacteriota bacterium]